MKYILHGLLTLTLCLSLFVDELQWDLGFWVQKVLLIIPLSLGLAHALSWLFKTSHKRYILLISFYFLASFGFLSSGIYISQTYVKTANLGNLGGEMEKSSLRAAEGLSDLLNREQYEKRAEVAGIIYQIYGIKVFFKQKNGEFQQYLPSEEEIQDVTDGVSADAENVDLQRQLIELYENMNVIIKDQTVTFIITFLLSLFIFSRKPKIEPSHD